jgi:RNA polymerase sigma-70 factor (ECF subfamily)
MTGDNGQITALLQSWHSGNRDALNQVLGLLENDLRQAARRVMNRQDWNRTLQPTALLSEAYLRLVVRQTDIEWKDRAHFIAICARLMREILVDAARHRRAHKRGGDLLLVSMHDAEGAAPDQVFDMIALDECLAGLARIDPRKVQVFELRFFVGLGVSEVADCLQISVPSVVRDWKFVRAWLKKQMSLPQPRATSL